MITKPGKHDLIFSRPIPLGKTSLDLTAWNRHCAERLGRTIDFGEKLGPVDLAALGFRVAAGLGSYGRYESAN
jgi:hypothetical protein